MEDSRWSRSVVRVTGSNGGFGSGFAIGSGRVLTCAHVIGDVGAPLEVDGHPASIAYDGTTDGLDLAVLEVALLADSAMPAVAAQFQRGQDVVAIGWSQVSNGHTLEPVRGSIDELTHLTFPAGSTRAMEAFRLHLRRPIRRGYSGGPIVDADDGTVLGVITLRHDEAVAHATALTPRVCSLLGLRDLVVVPRPLVATAPVGGGTMPRAASAPPLTPCPYPGMRPFSAAEASRFRGRRREIDDLLGRLRADDRQIFIIGPSGSGKSSLVLAGLLPRLQAPLETGGGTYLCRVLRPGIDPMRALVAALAGPGLASDVVSPVALGRDGAAGDLFVEHDRGVVPSLLERLLGVDGVGERLVLVIDQLEELFLTPNAYSRTEFHAALELLRTDARVATLLTLRADFYGALMESEWWREAGISRVDVAPLRGAALRAAIEEPAHGVGVAVEPALIERLYHHVADEPGTLPLLQEVLVALWDRRRDDVLRLADYAEMEEGGLHGLALVVARRADAAMRKLTAAQQELARRVLIRLVQFGNGRADTRRQQRWYELRHVGAAQAEVDEVIRHLVDSRLLTLGEAWGERVVDISHEILLIAWPALRTWIAVHRDDEQRRRGLEAQLGEWTRRGLGESGLLDAGELRDLDAWLTDETVGRIGLSEQSLEYIERSRGHEAKRNLAADQAAEESAQRDRLERELRVARQIQRSLLPAMVPQVVGLDFAVHYEPAYQIGGDFYDFIWHDEGHLGVSIGDVAGKAISAALYMARLSSELRSRAGLARTPARLLRRVNEEMVKLGDDGMFATLVYAIYELETRTLVFTNAGHCVPLLRRGEQVFPLQADRAHIAPIGVVPELEVGEARVQLHVGDVLVLVTDGILEARDARGNEYGILRLSRRLRTARGSADDVVKAILQDVDSHVGSGGLTDDITVLAMGIDERRARRRAVPEQDALE